MTTTALDFDFDTTLIRRGVHAATLTEMNEFVAMIEERPLDKLLADLPGFSQFSETKFKLAQMVFGRRMRELPEVEREQLRTLAEEVALETNAVVASRIRRLFR